MNARIDTQRLLPPQASGAAATVAKCFHCGLPVASGGNWTVIIDAVARPMCCPGCAAVAQAIVDYRIDGYYRERTAFAPPPGSVPGAAAPAATAAVLAATLALYDTTAQIDGFALDAATCEATFAVDGIRCAACVWLIEKRLRAVPGVLAAEINLASERLRVRWQRDTCRPSAILLAIEQVGYRAYPFDALRRGEQLRLESRRMLRRLFIAALSMMQVMMYALPLYIGGDGGMDADMAGLMRWAGLLLTLPALSYSAQPFFAGAWAGIRRGMPGMDLPVAIGIGAAFVGSTAATLRGAGEVYFDSITMFIFLLLCSRCLELAARRKAAAALETLQHARPAAATRLPHYPDTGGAQLVAAAALCAGEIILVKPGEAVAADAVLLDSSAMLDLSLISGESRPMECAAGDTVAGGALNAGQAIALRVLRPACDSTLSVLMKLVERAGQAKPQLALWADRVAVWFVGALMLLSLAVFCIWQVVDPSRAWPIAIAVLVVSCPCALSLATPAALAAVTERLLRQGILVVQPHVLETLHRVTHVVFDKTGTLTEGKPAVRAIAALADASPAWCLQAAAALESASAHPLAVALEAAARQARADDGAMRPLAALLIEETAGRGLEGLIDGRRVRLGRAEFVAELTGSALAPSNQEYDAGSTLVYLGACGGWLACFELADTIRADARAVVEFFQARGQCVLLLSGDAPGVTRQVAARLGIVHVDGDCMPQEKLAVVQALQASGAVVAMIGDGINDAAVLRAADVSFAMGAGAALAQAQADAVLMAPQLSALADAARAADQTMAIIRQNLAWATVYNLLAIPAAAIGWLDPWMTAAGMSLSSAVVVLNAWRLRRLPQSMPLSPLSRPSPPPRPAARA